MFKYIIFLLATQIGAAGFTFSDGSPVELSADGHLIWSRGQEIAINNWNVPYIELTKSTGAKFTCCLDDGKLHDDYTVDITKLKDTLVIRSNGKVIRIRKQEQTGGGWTQSKTSLGKFPLDSLTIVTYRQTFNEIMNEIMNEIKKEREQRLQEMSQRNLGQVGSAAPKPSRIKFKEVEVIRYTPDRSEHISSGHSKPTQAGSSGKKRGSTMVGSLEDWEGVHRGGLSHLDPYSQPSHDQKWELLCNTIPESSGMDVTVVTSKSESGPAIYQPEAVQEGASIGSLGIQSGTESAPALVPMGSAVPASPDIPAVTQAPAEDLGAHVQIVMQETDTSDKSQPGAESKNSVFGCCFRFC